MYRHSPLAVLILTLFAVVQSSGVVRGQDELANSSAPGSFGAGSKPTPVGGGATSAASKLPSLGSNAEAHAVNEAGTVVVGHSFDRAGLLYAVRWTRQNGVWVIGTLPYPGSAVATGIDNMGNVVGYGATPPRRPILWPVTGGYTLLGCNSDVAEARAISANGQVVVGQAAGRAIEWRTPQLCTEDLPPLEAGGSAYAHAVNGDGSITGGHAAFFSQTTGMPVRWIGLPGGRQIQQLDTRPGTVRGANADGDLAGYVTIPCGLAEGCPRAVIWYATGDSLDLGAFGGEKSWIRDINAAGEVAGVITSGTNSTALFWSPSIGRLQLLPGNKSGVANGLSDSRPDGTRLVVGMESGKNATVWVVRTP